MVIAIIISAIVLIALARKGSTKPKPNTDQTNNYIQTNIRPKINTYTPTNITRQQDIISTFPKASKTFVPPKPIVIPEETGEYLKDREVIIKYHDRNDAETKRKIIIENIYFNGGQYPDTISAFCLLRKERRTFYFDRIGQATCTETGVIYDDFYKYAIATIPSHPKYKFLQVINNLKDELNIFIFASKSDGYLRKKERDIVTEYLANYSDYPLDLIDAEIKMLECSQHHFTRSLNKVAQKDIEHRGKVAEFAKRIIHSDKNVTPIELDILDKINSKLIS